MASNASDRITTIRDFPSLLSYLQEDLDWPVDLQEIDELTFDYSASDLGLDESCKVAIKEIKQIRPFTSNQPWGVFWIEFEKRHLPVMVLRRILRELVPKKRATARSADRAVWQLRDLLFISSLGEQGHRRITFSHFREQEAGEPTLETFSWDDRETHFFYLSRVHLDRLRWPSNPRDVESWRCQWAAAFTTRHREPVRTAKELSEELAALASRTKGLVLEILKIERSDGPLHRLFESFQKVLVHDLKEDGFADMIAQTIAYGLFSARCTGQQILGLAHLEAMVPNTNRFLKELFAELARISGHQKGQINFDDLGLSEMVDLLRDTNIEAVLEDFGRQTGGGREDPVVHFYETFLGVYNKQQKVQRGVFYTPKPVVSFIVRSVHEILQTEFGLPDGLADTTTWREMGNRHPALEIPAGVKPDSPFVLILDPATGTGTFLEEVIEVIHQTMMSKWRKQGTNAAERHEAWNEYVPKHLLPRLHGFELMMAPYSVAHMKLGLKLRQTEYDFNSNQQLRVYLTNTLEPPEKGNRKLGFLPDFLSHESMQADLVKERKPITVVIGNPPYSGHSANKGKWSRDLLRMRLRDRADSYFNVDGISLNERNPKWLNDDYVKFLRYGQHRIASTGIGILGFITNHSYMDNPTFRGMRQSLTVTFPRTWLIDLHGNTKKKEGAISGRVDENVFDIQQGVAIALFTCPPRPGNHVRHAELWGDREAKYDWLLSHMTGNSGAVGFDVDSPQHLFVPRHSSIEVEYTTGISLPELFPISSAGIVTARDHLTIHWTKDEVWSTIRLLARLETEQAREKFALGQDVRDWRVEWAQADINDSGPNRNKIVPILYRPFDRRFTYYTGRTTGFICMPRPAVMRHFLAGPNLGLITSRQTKDEWAALVTDTICGHKTCAAYDINTVFPLYVYESSLGLDGHGGSSLVEKLVSVPNISETGIHRFAETLGLTWCPNRKPVQDGSFGPEDVFAYVYAICSSTGYKRRFTTQLRSDFARIPITANLKLFRTMCNLGQQLIDVHLLKDVSPTTVRFAGQGEQAVERADYQETESRVYINVNRYFSPVPTEVWTFVMGGYQVCKKWLKDRRGLTLKDEDVLTYRKILASIGATLQITHEIDQVIDKHGGWPITQKNPV